MALAVGRLPMHRHWIVDSGADPGPLQRVADGIPRCACGRAHPERVLVVDMTVARCHGRPDEAVAVDGGVIVRGGGPASLGEQATDSCRYGVAA